MGLFERLKNGLRKTKESLSAKVDDVLKVFVKVDEALFEELEDALILADLGAQTSCNIIEKLRDRVKTARITDGEQVKKTLIEIISEILLKHEPVSYDEKTIILVIGVNGVGKTTTIGKLASKEKAKGRSVLLCAADTFRAAAIDQLDIWATRAAVPIIKHEEGSDPASVIFDACASARSKNIDILMCDTAGRLHNKKNLMEELKKIDRIITKELPGYHKEVLLVLDATTGQNAISQMTLFSESAPITGIALTKIDGASKGGIVISICDSFNIPVRYVGVGEGIDDLQDFNAREFVEALF